MRLTKEEMILSIKNHTSNKIPNWPPEIVKQFIEVIETLSFVRENYPNSSIIPIVMLRECLLRMIISPRKT